MPLRFGGCSSDFAAAMAPSARPANTPWANTLVLSREARHQTPGAHEESVDEQFLDGTDGPEVLPESVTQCIEVVGGFVSQQDAPAPTSHAALSSRHCGPTRL